MSADKVVSVPVMSSIERKCLGIPLRLFKARSRQDIGDCQALEVNIYAISFELLKKKIKLPLVDSYNIVVNFHNKHNDSSSK